MRRSGLAYLTNQYPKGSHTFIRREIAALESRGWGVRRLSIRRAREPLTDPADLAERERTHVCLDEGVWRLTMDVLVVLLARPARFLDAARLCWRMHAVSERGVVRHLAYLVEACHLLLLSESEGWKHVHVHFGTNAAAVARLVRKLGGPSYSLTIHGPGEFDAPVALSLGGKVEDASFAVAISQYGSAQLRRWVHPDAWQRIHVVRCGVDEAFLANPYPIEPDSRRFVSVGRLTPQKGQLLLLEAFVELVREEPTVELVLVGDGELRATLETKIETLGLRGHARVAGWCPEEEVRGLLRGSRALVMPSFAEGLPVAIMEALALGRPVIASAIAGIPELVRDKESGWLVIAGDRSDLVRAMRECLMTPAEVLMELAKRGRERVQASHDVSQEVAHLDALLTAAMPRSEA